MTLHAVATFQGYLIKKVVLVLFVNKHRILTVTERSGKVGFLSGYVETFDTKPFKAIKREYKEETGHKLPKLKDIQKFVYRDDTAIYVASTKDYVSTTIIKRNSEIKAMHLTEVTDIKSALKGTASFTLRNSAMGSTQLLFKKLNL